MTEPLYIAWLCVIGGALISTTSRSLSRLGIIGLALPTGAAVYMLSGLVLVAAGSRFSTVRALFAATALTVVVVGCAAAFTNLLNRGNPWPRVLDVVVAASLACAAAAVFTTVPLTRLNTDSYRYLINADVLERTGGISAMEPLDVRMRLIGTPMLHTIGVVTGRGYSGAITPLMALSGATVMSWVAATGFELLRTPRRWRHVLVLVAAITLLSSNRVLYSAFYVNGHLAIAVWLLVVVAAGWYATIRREAALFLVAGFALGACAVMRPEGAITAAFFAVPFLTARRIPSVASLAMLGPYVGAVVVWNGLIYPTNALEGELGIVGPVRGPLVVAGAVVAVAALRNRRRLRWPMSRASGMALGLTAGTVVVWGALEPRIVFGTLNATFHNLLRYGMWGALWWVLIPLLILGATRVRFPLRRVWIDPLPLYAFALVAFSLLRGSPYRIGWSDSGNRMLMHVILVAATYLVLAGAAIVRPRPEASDHVIDLDQLARVDRTAAPTPSPVELEDALEAPASLH